jgi:sensor histidine kinase YesM
LLTLVENAVTHGIAPKLGPGAIKITGRVENGMLTVEVEDDGPGLKPGLTPGVGLANVRAQLQSLFGDQARLEIASAKKGGVAACISTPIKSR